MWVNVNVKLKTNFFQHSFLRVNPGQVSQTLLAEYNKRNHATSSCRSSILCFSRSLLKLTDRLSVNFLTHTLRCQISEPYVFQISRNFLKTRQIILNKGFDLVLATPLLGIHAYYATQSTQQGRRKSEILKVGQVVIQGLQREGFALILTKIGIPPPPVPTALLYCTY